MPMPASPAPRKRIVRARNCRARSSESDAKRPARHTDAVPWMSSLKQQARSSVRFENAKGVLVAEILELHQHVWKLRGNRLHELVEERVVIGLR